MKKIVFLLEYRSISGGMCQSVLSLVNGLSKTGKYKIYIISPKNSDISVYPFNNNVINITTSKSDWKISKSSILKLLLTAFEVSRLIKKHVPSDTLVITNNVGSSIVASLVSLFIRIREVYVNRGGNFQELGFGSIIMRKKLRCGKFHALIATSKRQKSILNQYSNDAVTIIPNGLPLPRKVYEFTPLSKEELVIGTIGFVSDTKNYAEGIKTIELLRKKGVNAILNIYGEVGSKSDKIYYDSLVVEIKERNLEPFVKFMGYVSDDSKFCNSDIIVSFSKSEGFGRTLVEAMLRHKPIIAWRGAGGPVDITNNGKCGILVERNTAEEFTSSIIELINDTRRSREVAEMGYQFAMENFTVDSMIENYDSFFKSL